MAACSTKHIATAMILVSSLLGNAAAQMRVPEVGKPVCVVAFCPSGSKHPNMQIDCSSDGCECFDSCGGGSESRPRSSGSQGGGGLPQLLSSAVVAAAKVVFLVTAPGHASEALSKRPSNAAEARQRFRDYQAGQAALSRQGRELAVEVAALRQFERAVRQREENPHRYLMPLFQPTQGLSRMNVADPLQQLRCINAAMLSAAAAVDNGIPGDISFLDARRAVDIAAGSWDSGLAPAGCGGAPLSASVLELQAVQRQRRYEEILVQLQSAVVMQAEQAQLQAQVDTAKQRAEAERQRFAEAQNQKLAAAEEAVRAAQLDAQAKRRAVEQEPSPEPPPGPSPKLPENPESDLWQRLLRANAQSEAQLQEATQALAQTKKDNEAALQKYAADAAAQLKPAQDSLNQANAALGASLEALNKEFAALGLTPRQTGATP